MDTIMLRSIGSLFIAMILVLTGCYLWVTGEPVPDELVNILLTVVGFFIGHVSNNGFRHTPNDGDSGYR